MRAKMKITGVKRHATDDGKVTQVDLTMVAVSKSGAYPDDGTDEDNSFAKWTPSASLTMSITNPDLFESFEVDDNYYLDFTKAE